MCGLRRKNCLGHPVFPVIPALLHGGPLALECGTQLWLCSQGRLQAGKPLPSRPGAVPFTAPRGRQHRQVYHNLKTQEIISDYTSQGSFSDWVNKMLCMAFLLSNFFPDSPISLKILNSGSSDIELPRWPKRELLTMGGERSGR